MNKAGYNTLVEAEYDEASKVSKVTKEGKYGKFTAYARVHPEDYDVANYWDGLTIAEAKVDTMVQQEKAKVFRNRLEGAEMVLDYLDMCGVPQNDEVYKRVARKIAIMTWEYNAEYRKFKRMSEDGLDQLVEFLHMERKEFEELVKKNKEKMEE